MTPVHGKYKGGISFMSKGTYKKPEVNLEIESTEKEEIVDTPKKEVVGVVTASKLRLRSEPNSQKNENIKCFLSEGTEVLIDESKSTTKFYKVLTKPGDEGYCMKEYIKLRGE